VAGCVWLVAVRAPAAGKKAVLPGEIPADPGRRWMGVATCASMSCHHANGPAGTKGSEYSTWAGYDNHARAFQVLYDDRSKQMVRNLWPEKHGQAPHPETEPVCLKCHASGDGGLNDDGTPKGNLGPRFALADGVGCESCHGAAEKWLTVHYQPGFKDLPAEKKAELGLRNTRKDRDLSVRAKLCTECHVGDANKDVNHDLIAAGHPRLNFEFGAFHAMYPKHWPVAADRDRYGQGFEARAWAVGQVVTARAALELLQARAASAAKGGENAKPWPEFSEYACFACHKDLRVIETKGPAQKRPAAGRRIGSLPWGTWYVTMPEVYGAESGGEGKKLAEDVGELRELMERPGLRPDGVVGPAREAVKALDGWLKEVQGKPAMTPEGVRRLMAAFAREAQTRKGALNWDEASQRYLALGALHQALQDLTCPPSPPPLREDLLKMRRVREDLLRIRRTLKDSFKAGFDSPREFTPAAERGVRDLFGDIRKQLGP
jgi:hypothetical protein